jgi:ABC-type bacteriocin/lantibiotic exporter with double-glycine peptidase domain
MVLFGLMVVASFAEVLTIGAIVPFLGVLIAPQLLFDNEYARVIFSTLSLTDPDQILLPVTFLFVFFAIFSGFTRLCLLWLQIRLGYSIGADLSLSIYRLTLYQPYAVHLGRNSSELIATISSKADVIVNSAILPVMILVSSCLMACLILLTLITISPLMALLSFTGFGLIYLVVALLTKKTLGENGRIANRESTNVIKALQEGLGGIRDVLLDGTQEVYCDFYRKADSPLRRAKANIQVISNSPRFAIEALGMALIAVLAYALAIRSEGLTGAIPLLGALTLGAQRLLPILQQSYQTWSSVKGSHPILVDALDLLSQPKPEYADQPNFEALTFQHSICLDQLYFSYAGTQRQALINIELSIPKGSRIGFIGSTGSGKSTLLDIVMGLLSPTRGRLVVDGIEVTVGNSRAWQNHIAHVPQAIFLADCSIAENIAFGVPRSQIDYLRIERAIKLAQLTETMETLPLGFDTQVGERGVRLSGGQRQRIGIARALYKNADVIVFDEATSALDNETESAVISAIDGLSSELTILMVAHRLTTLKNCTQIVEMSAGRIKRIGSYASIIQN